MCWEGFEEGLEGDGWWEPGRRTVEAPSYASAAGVWCHNGTHLLASEGTADGGKDEAASAPVCAPEWR